jgi:TPR repeat protein
MYLAFILVALALAYWLYKKRKRDRIIDQYMLAAKAGDAESQFEMGTMYQYGRGVPQDFVRAVELYCHAAEQGHIGAQSNLGVLYASGQGVPQNYAEALNCLQRLQSRGMPLPKTTCRAFAPMEKA